MASRSAASQAALLSSPADRFHFTSRALSLPTEHCEQHSVPSSLVLVPSNAVSRDMEGRKALAIGSCVVGVNSNFDITQ